MRSAIRSFLSLLVTGCLLFLMAAPPSIGVVQSSGEFPNGWVDGERQRYGVRWQHHRDRLVAIHNPAGGWIGNRTRAVFPRANLQRSYRFAAGVAAREEQPKASDRAASLRISPADAHSVAEIVTSDNNRVSVAAREGLVDVRNGAGVLVATVRPGLALAFTTQAGGAATASKMGGCLVKKRR